MASTAISNDCFCCSSSLILYGYWGCVIKKIKRFLLALNIYIVYVSLGIIYDVIVEPPSIGSTTDEKGHSRPVIFYETFHLKF